MAKNDNEEELLRFSPKRKQEENFDDWTFLDDEEEVVEEPVYQDIPEAPVFEAPVEEEPVYEEPVYEEPVYEEPEYVEEEVVEEPVYEEVAEEPEVVEEYDLGDVEAEEFVEEEVPEEVDIDDVVAEEFVEEEPVAEEVVEEPALEEYVEEEPQYVPVFEEEEEEYDRTNIFEHAKVYYDQNTTILPRNFESRIKMASDDVKKIYSDIKNVLMEYSGVKCRMLKYVEVFRCGGAVAKMRIKGKSLYLYLRIDPASVDQDYLKVVDKSERRGYEETPSEIKVTGKRKCKRSIEMIRLMMDALGVGHRRHPEVVDYAAKYPTPENAVIYGKNMVRVSKKSDM